MKKAIIITVIIFIAILLIILVWAWAKGRTMQNNPTVNPPNTGDNTPPVPPNTPPVPIDPISIIGKRAFGNNINIYSAPNADTGYWWDFTGLSSTVMCHVNLTGQTVTGVESGSVNQNDLFYKIHIDNFDLCGGNEGYVKANEITLKQF